MPDPPRCVAHLDMDAFYASVELRRRPELKGKPVVVCGSGPRAVVTTASYEARRLAGIHSAMPAAVARRRLPDAVYLRPDFNAYREASGEVMAILRRNAETVEVVGLDEAYVDLTGLFSPKATMRRIATEIREETRLTCSIGISESRMLAKITSELGKPAGLVVLSRAEALERFAGESPGLVPGIGPKTVARLERMGIRTLAELGARDEDELSTPSARARAAGSAPRPASKTRRRSSSSTRPSRSRPRSPSTSTSPTARRWPPRSSRSPRSSAGGCARATCAGRTIGIKVRLDDWTNVTRSHTVEEPTDDPARGRPRSRSTCCAPTRRRGRCGCSGSGSPSSATASRRRGERPGAPPDAAQPPRLSRRRSAAREDDAEVGEVQPLLGRLGQVEVAAGDVGAAVDDRHGDRAAAVAEPHLGPAGQRLVGDAERARLQRAAAGERRRRRGPARSRRRPPAGRR